ncbi:zf-HC2 domain-containing protein [Herbivorax sp. ANBcel31]|uniref:zf-HC2 domain-containing protein n=1 Tax=Herbivorax sp. ANBcel31 TaxID=3069754 RepID=UPI0027AF8177|nr:zf-HC2 domain-containing protein [Herbivorax sp. ANBcel31]MDQ2086289.1 zf-HC2 domain-containing protein [Herbivorax sp. ANBcel31]
MNCNDIKKLMEEYIMGELDKENCKDLEKHINECDSCKNEYEETKQVIGELQNLKKSIKIKGDILDMNTKNILKSTKQKRHNIKRMVSGIAVGMFIIMFLFTGSIVAFPTFASNYIPEQFPVIRQFNEVQNNFNLVTREIEEIKRENNNIKRQNEEIKMQNEEIKLENEQLKKTIKEIEGESIPEYQTSEGIGYSDNQRIQEMVIRFIKALYSGDTETMKKMCTDEFRKELEEERSEILFNNRGDYVYSDSENLVFTQITNVAKEGEMYLVFVRLNDGSYEEVADYQLNFHLEKIDEEFRVSVVEKDA